MFSYRTVPLLEAMPHTPFEDRFIDVLQYMTGHELAQEISMPRKVRRLDAATLPPGRGLSFWRWLGRARDDDDANARLLDLLADDQLPMIDRKRFMEAIMDNQFAVSEPERETASQRVRREGREEGLEEGERKALFSVAARFVPDALPALRAIRDIDALRQAVDTALARKLGD